MASALARSAPGRPGRQGGDRVPGRRQRRGLLVELQQEVGQPLVGAAEQDQVRAGAQVAQQPAQLVHGPADVAGVGGRHRRAQREIAPLDAAQADRVSDALPQRQGQVIVPVRLGRRGQPLGLPAGLDRGGEGGRDVVASQRVVGKLGGGARDLLQPAFVGQQLSQRAVQPGALAGQQVGVDGLAQQSVPEGQAAVAVRD